jgi:ribonuclease VapC
LPDRVLLDSSALLALFRQEPGAGIVAAALAACAVSTVNLAETTAKLIERGMPETEAAGLLAGLALPVLPFDAAEAATAGGLLGRHRGPLSLGDCACIATARRHGLPVLTGDRIWATLDLGVEVRLIR